MGLFKRKIIKNKQNYSYFVYKMDTFDQKIMENYMHSNHSGDGIYGFEIYKSSTETKIQTFSPSFHRLELPIIQLGLQNIWTHETECYEIELESPSFLPLYVESPINLINEIAELKVVDGSIFTQILLSEHKGNWRDSLISQYEHYLLGNDYPVSNRSIRNVQTKILRLIDKMTNYQSDNQPVQEVEDKILQPNYQMEIRFLITCKNKKEIVEQLKELLGRMNYFNRINLYKVADSDSFVDSVHKRSLNSFSGGIYYSKSEVMALLSSENCKPITVSPLAINKPSNIEVTASNMIHLLPKGDVIEKIVNYELSKSLGNAFKREGITKNKLKIESVEQGATLQKITCVIPSDTSYSKIKKNMENIQATLGNDTIGMEIGDKPETVNFYLPCDNREVVYLRKLMESEEYLKYTEDAVLPFVVGEDATGHPLFADLQKLVHILIAGTTGSGKSVFLNSLIVSLILAKTPQELNLYLIDPKTVELSAYNGIPHVKKVITDMNKAYSVFESLINEMEKRYAMFSDEGVRSLIMYNQKRNTPLPYLVCVVDEFADLMSTNKGVEVLIQRLGQKARAAGIHLVIATQRPSVDVITGVIKSNLPSTFCLRLKTSVDYTTALGKKSPYNLLGNGDGLAGIEGSKKEFERFQSACISLDDDEVLDFLDKLKGVSDYDDYELEVAKPENSIDKLKRIIATTGETRVAKLREEMEIRINDVSDLIKQLVEEGWLEKQGKSYQLIAPEDEISKYRTN